MTSYFILGALASFFIVLALIVILFYMLRRNWNHENKTRISYIAPVLVVALIVYLSITEFFPRALDVISIANHQFEMAEVEISDSSVARNSLVVDGRTFFFSSGTFEGNDRGRYQIAYTPRMRFIVNATRLGDTSLE